MMKYAVCMLLPDGKMPGFYAQIVKALAALGLHDREKELLIVDAEDKLEAVESVLDRYQVESERLAMIELPREAVLGPMFDGCGFTTRQEHSYVFYEGIRAFHLLEAPSEEHASACEQVQEHLVACFQSELGTCYIVEAHQTQLVEGIAAAYGVGVCWVDEIMNYS